MELLSPLAPINQVLTQTAASTPERTDGGDSGAAGTKHDQRTQELDCVKKWPFVSSKSFLGVDGSRILDLPGTKHSCFSRNVHTVAFYQCKVILKNII